MFGSVFGRILWAKIAAAMCAMVLTLSPAAAQETEELMELSLDDLLDMDISVATKTKTSVEKAPSIVSVITGEEIRNMGARNIADVLRTVPGFDVIHMVNMPVHQISVRGMRSSQYNNKIKIMINGHDVGVADGTNAANFDVLPIANIRQIEIIRGPGSALYGTGAFLGVINLVTRKGGEGPSELTLEGGSHGTFHPLGRLSYEKDDLRVSLYADWRTTDGYDGILESDMTLASPAFASAVPGEMTADSEDCSIHADLGYKNLSLSLFFQKLDTNNPIGVTRALTDENSIGSLYAFGEMGWRLPMGDKGSLHFKAYHDRYEIDNEFELFPEETAALPMHTGFPQGEGLRSNALVSYSVLGGEGTADYEFREGIRLVGGLSYEYLEQFDPEHHANYNLTGSPLSVGHATYPAFPYQYFPFGDISENGNMQIETDRTVAALFGQGQFDLRRLLSLEKWSHDLSLTAGLRYDHYDDVGDTLNPRFGLVFAPTERLWFKTLYGTAFRAPTFRELYIRNNPGIIGNPELEPETITTLEALVGYDLSENMKASLTFFHVKAEDLIQGMGKAYRNVGTVESEGVEAELRMRLGRNRYAYLNMTWQDVKNTTRETIVSESGQRHVQEDFHPGNTPEFMGNLGINWDFFKERVIGNLSLNYVGKRERSEEMRWDGDHLVRADTREAMDDRTLVNASLTFRNLVKGMEFQISGFNLFDTDHRNPDPDARLPHDMPESGRWFAGRISCSF